MLKVKIASYYLREQFKEDHSRFEFFKLCNPKSQYTLQNYLDDKGYDDIDILVNELELLPEWCFKHMEVSVMKPLHLLQDERYGIDSRRFKELIAQCQIHLPGNDLLRINNTKVLEDACTDALQEELDKGWRIISVCPIAGNRRPDYVLGRIDIGEG